MSACCAQIGASERPTFPHPDKGKSGCVSLAKRRPLIFLSFPLAYNCIPLLFFFRCWPHCSSSLLEVTRQAFHRLRDRQPQTYRPRLYVRRAFSQCPVSSFQTFLCVRRAPSRISLTCTGRSSLISYVLPSASTRLVVQRAYKAHGPPRARRHPLPSSSFFPH